MNEFIDRVTYSYIRKGQHIIKEIVTPKPPILLRDIVRVKISQSTNTDAGKAILRHAS